MRFWSDPMPATASEQLVVLTPPQALPEARSLFASYAPRFESRLSKLKTTLEEIKIGVVYISHPDQDHAAEDILRLLGDLNVATLVLYAPHHGTDFAFHAGTIVGQLKFKEAEWAFNLPHLRQILKSRHVLAHARDKSKQSPSFDVREARTRLGLSQEELAKALNLTTRTVQNWEAGKATSQMIKKTRELRELIELMDDYVEAPKEKNWLSTSLEAFRGRTPKELIAAGRIRDLVTEFERLREGQPA